MASRWTLDNASLRAAIVRVVPFTAPNEARSILTGVQLLGERDALRLVAADGIRLTSDTAVAAGLRPGAINVVLPAGLMEQLMDQLPTDGRTILHVDRRLVTFETDGSKLSAAPMDGKYPDYRLIMPRTVIAEVHLEREAVLSACGLLTPALTTITFHFGESDVVTVRDGGSGRTAQATVRGVAAARVSNGAVDVSFNARYLAEALDTMAASQVLMRSGGARGSLLLTEVGNHPDFLHVLMPAAPAS